MIKLSSVILVGLLSATGVNDLKVVADRSTTIPQPTATVLIPQAQMPDEQSSENPAERTTWILSAWTERSEPKILLASPEITLNLSPDQFTGFASCNQYGGSYELDQRQITVGPIRSTRKACPEEIMTQEFQYLRALEGATRYELDAQGQLQIVYSQGEISGVLTFKPQSIDSLDGSSWTLQTWDDPQSPDFPLAETAITLSFAEGRIAGSSGCNRYMAAYEVEGNRLKVDTPAGTLKACPEPIMGQESKFLAALTHIQNYQITPDQQLKIIYQTPNHSGAMVFIPDSSSN